MIDILVYLINWLISYDIILLYLKINRIIKMKKIKYVLLDNVSTIENASLYSLGMISFSGKLDCINIVYEGDDVFFNKMLNDKLKKKDKTNRFDFEYATLISGSEQSDATILLSTILEIDKIENNENIKIEESILKNFMDNKKGARSSFNINQKLKINLKQPEKNELILYTDASIKNENGKNYVGYGIVVRKPNSDLIMSQVKGFNVFENEVQSNEAEYFAAERAVKYFLDLLKEGKISSEVKEVIICMDNIEVVKQANNLYKNKEMLDKKFKLLINKVKSKGFDLSVKWIPGHHGHVFNEMSDRLSNSYWRDLSLLKLNNSFEQVINDENLFVKGVKPRRKKRKINNI